MKFKVLEFVRKIRDESYEKSKNLNSKEKIEYTKKIADKFKKKVIKRGFVHWQRIKND